MLNRTAFILFSLLIVSIQPAFATKSNPNTGCNPEKDWVGQEWGEATVVRAVDGDTIKISANGKLMSVRMLSIDTPETHFLNQTQGYWGEAAAQEMMRILPAGSKVRLEFGVEKCDRYARVLAHVWYGDKNINKHMLEKALAVNYCIFPNVGHCAEYAEIVKNKVAAKEGIFSDPSLEVPYLWRLKISERHYEKPVGSLSLKTVWDPAKVLEIPLHDRLFFMHWSHVKAPYVAQ